MRHGLQLLVTFFTLTLFSLTFAYAEPETPSTTKPQSPASTASNDAGKININTASADELRALKGVGKKRAQQIVKDREENGPFSSPKTSLESRELVRKQSPKTFQ